MPEITLIDAICDDHEKILSRIHQLCSGGTTKLSKVRELTVVLGAHHLAEEETLYDALKELNAARVGEAQVYHLVLDDLSYSIENRSHLDEPLRYQIMLLEHLLRNHFLMEETVLLERFVESFGRHQQLSFGQLYRKRYLHNLSVITARGKSVVAPYRPPARTR